MNFSSEFSRTYNSFSGVDIQATFAGTHLSDLQGISYTVTREKGPLYTMGNPSPRAFSRGKFLPRNRMNSEKAKGSYPKPTLSQAEGTPSEGAETHWMGRAPLNTSLSVRHERCCEHIVQTPTKAGDDLKRGIAGLIQQDRVQRVNLAYIGEPRKGNTEGYLSHPVGYDEPCRDYS
jgi:hypothetical protein